MKNLLKIRFIVLLSLLSTTLFTSCKKEDDPPAYVGTWALTGVMNVNGENMEMKDIVVLTENAVQETMQVKNQANNKWIDVFGLKGNLTVNGDIFTVEVKEIGNTTYEISGMPTGVIVYYKDTQSEFNDFLEQISITKTMQSKFEITGNNLTIKTDKNKDGDYNDEGEVDVYLKQ